MKKFLSCLNSFLPIILTIIGLAMFIPPIIAMEATDMPANDMLVALILCFVGLLFVAVAAILALAYTVVYTVKACKNETFTSAKKAIWVVLFWCVGPVVFPIFWFVVVRKEYN